MLVLLLHKWYSLSVTRKKSLRITQSNAGPINYLEHVYMMILHGKHCTQKNQPVSSDMCDMTHTSCAIYGLYKWEFSDSWLLPARKFYWFDTKLKKSHWLTQKFFMKHYLGQHMLLPFRSLRHLCKESSDWWISVSTNQSAVDKTSWSTRCYVPLWRNSAVFQLLQKSYKHSLQVKQIGMLHFIVF